jgi:hypothetical protein
MPTVEVVMVDSVACCTANVEIVSVEGRKFPDTVMLEFCKEDTYVKLDTTVDANKVDTRRLLVTILDPCNEDTTKELVRKEDPIIVEKKSVLPLTVDRVMEDTCMVLPMMEDT